MVAGCFVGVYNNTCPYGARLLQIAVLYTRACVYKIINGDDCTVTFCFISVRHEAQMVHCHGEIYAPQILFTHVITLLEAHPTKTSAVAL